jgi:hypothetical protein
MNPAELSAMLAGLVAQWLAENEYIDPTTNPADWRRWEASLAVLLAEVVTDPQETPAARLGGERGFLCPTLNGGGDAVGVVLESGPES